MIRVFAGISVLVLFAALGVFGILIYREKKEEKEYKAETEKLQQVRPNDIEESGNEASATAEEAVHYLADLQAVNPDVVAWLSVPGTVIDFPVVQGEDNAYYLHYDLEGNSSRMGVPFLDIRCSGDFSDFHSVIYGHYISGGRMFAGLAEFRKEDFFSEHESYTLITDRKKYDVQIIACLITPSDGFVYDTVFLTEQEKSVFLREVKEQAVCVREFSEQELLDAHIVTLSTCAYEYEGARTVVIGYLAE